MNNITEARKRKSVGLIYTHILPIPENIEKIRKLLYDTYKFTSFSGIEFYRIYKKVMSEFSLNTKNTNINILNMFSSKRIIKQISCGWNWWSDEYRLIPRKNNTEELIEFALEIF